MSTRLPPEEKPLRMLSFAAHAASGVIRHQGMRRRAMLGILAAALVMLVAGSTFLASTLDPREHAAWYIIYWLACAWLTITAMLLALFDVLIVRAQGRGARKVLQEHVARAARTKAGDDAHGES